MIPIREWLPPGKTSAVVFTIDDVHPGRSTDAYEAGGDLQDGALGMLEQLLDRHPYLRMTLFVTPDWREISAHPTRRLVKRIPVVRDRVYLSRVLPRGTMRLDRHPEFVRYVAGLPRTEAALHGLHHIHTGLKIYQEFQEDQSRETCASMLRASMQIFRDAGLPFGMGMQPPGWVLTPALEQASVDVGLEWVCSARDVLTAPSDDAVANMSGLKGVSLVHPTLIAGGRLVHVTSNFQATSRVERAHETLALGGVLAVKAHIMKNAMGHIALDGVDPAYCNYLDMLFRDIHREHGDSVYWCTMSELSARVRAVVADRTAHPTPLEAR